MSEHLKPKSIFIELTAIIIGVATGGIIGPFLFHISYLAAVILGCLAGGICGFTVAWVSLTIRRLRRDGVDHYSQRVQAARALARPG